MKALFKRPSLYGFASLISRILWLKTVTDKVLQDGADLELALGKDCIIEAQGITDAKHLSSCLTM